MKKQDFLILSAKYQFMIDCCQETIETTTLSLTLASYSDQAYHSLHTLSHQHGIYPLLYKSVQAIQPHSLSKEMQERYKQSSMRITQHNMLMSAELLDLMQLFENNSIDAMAFKGPVLGAFAYGSITLRQYGDLDILIKRDDIEKSLLLLQTRGYVPEIELEESTLETFYNCVNVIGLQKGSIRVEIHWELLSSNYAIDWNEVKLWSENERIDINKQSIKMLSFTNHILYLCAHGSKHLFERLEWVCDIDRAVRSQEHVEWDVLLQEAKALGIERMLLFGLSLAQEFFSLPLPQEIKTKIAADKELSPLKKQVITLHYSEQDGTKSYSTFWLLWQMRENISDRLRFAYRALFAPKFDDFKFVQLPKQLLFLYPLIRPYRLVTKYFKR